MVIFHSYVSWPEGILFGNLDLLTKSNLIHFYLVGGWALPLWKIKEFVSWDDEIPSMMGKTRFMFQTTNQFFNHHIPIVVCLYHIFNHY